MGFMSSLFGSGAAAGGTAATGTAIGGGAAAGISSSAAIGADAVLGASITNAATSAGNLLPAAQASAASASSPLLTASTPTMTQTIAAGMDAANTPNIFQRGYTSVMETLGDQKFQDMVGAEILKGMGTTRGTAKGAYGTNQARGYDQVSLNPVDKRRQVDPASLGKMFM